ncbi:MAG: DUF5107 domain-containing protein [Balneolaceae bacterium]|nr:DUF5107 domain-containing protein [Balneolaceae bacterium]
MVNLSKSKHNVHIPNEKVVMENDRLLVKILPEMGGKITHITRKYSGTEFLKQSNTVLEKTRLPKYGQDFLPPYAAGFDECFPNISPSVYKHASGRKIYLPDHGELWSQSWKFEQIGDCELKLWMDGVQLDYRFNKTIKLKGNSVQILYEVENWGDSKFEYIWSSHPLLEVDEGDKLLLPDEVTEVFNGVSNQNNQKTKERIKWPQLNSLQLDHRFDEVHPPSSKFAGKFFTDRLQSGLAGLYRAKFDESILFQFDTKKVPYLGIWLCYGGWPNSSKQKDYTVALEPCSSRPDSLNEAIKWGEHKSLEPKNVSTWELEVQIHDGQPNISKI